ncbi:MAG: WbqC family protein [Candidatus Sumerlaeota bacterium]|nr:WbqC family protein [Candidatus Sumerlaeota bacterium]
MIVSINQPCYLPWLGYLHRIAVSDLHIVLDHVQFEKNSFTNRNKIRTKEGWCWLTVPLQTKGKFGELPICDLAIADDPRWAKKHWAAIQQNYSKAPYFAAHAGFFEGLYNRECTRLWDVMNAITTYLLQSLEIRTPLRRSSEMGVGGHKDELVLNLCKAVNADLYLSGPLGRDYLREEIFDQAGIKVAYHDYKHPVYSQVYPGFESYMTALDLLFNHGPESGRILRENQQESFP